MPLIAHWSCDGGSLPTVTDLSGNARHGTVVGDVTAVAGKVLGGLQLGGDDDYVEVPHDSALALSGGAFTIAAWIYPTSYGQFDNGRVVAKGSANPSSGGPGWTVMVDAADGGTFAVDINAQGRRRSAAGSIALDTWQHIAARLSGGDIQLFVDGAPSGAPHTSAETPGASTNALRLGIRAHDLQREFAGILDEVRLYDEALSDAQIEALATIQSVAIGAAAVSVGGQALTAAVDEALTVAAVTVEGQDLTDSLAGLAELGAAAVTVAGGSLVALPRPVTWREQVENADRYVPQAAPPEIWWSEKIANLATLGGTWVAGEQASPINPHSYRTSGAAWIDIEHSDRWDFARGVTVWLTMILHAITARAVVLTTGGTAGDEGSFSIEVQPPANGSLVRAWLVEGGSIRYFGGSSSLSGGVAGSKIIPGAPTSLALTMGENGAALAVNGETLATLDTIGTWRAVAKRFGAWTDGSAQIDATLADLRFYGALDAHQVRMMHASQLDWWARLGFGVVAPAPAAVAVGAKPFAINEAITPAAAAVSVGGQDVTPIADGAVEIGEAAIAVGGQALAVDEGLQIGDGAVTVAGQDLAALVNAVVEIGEAAVSVAGQDLATPLELVINGFESLAANSTGADPQVFDTSGQTHSAGDYLMAVCGADGGATIDGMAGGTDDTYTLPLAIAGTNVNLGVGEGTLVSALDAALSVNLGAARDAVGGLITISGAAANASQPDVTPSTNTGSSDSPVCSGITTSGKTIVFAIFHTNGGHFSGGPPSAPTGTGTWILLYAGATGTSPTNSALSSVAIAYQIFESGGPTGDATWSAALGASRNWAATQYPVRAA